MPVYPIDDRQTPLLGQKGPAALSDAAREDYLNSAINGKSCKPQSIHIIGWQPPPPRPTQKISRARGIPDLPQGGYSPLSEDFRTYIHCQAHMIEDDIYSCPLEIRHSFIRKVYGILLFQSLAIMGIGGLVLRSHKLVTWVEENTWAYYTTLGIAIASLLTLCFVHLRFQAVNALLLAVFTVCEALWAGVSIAAYDTKAVMKALIIATGVFLGLTLSSFQPKHDFDNVASYLSGCLSGLFFTGVVTKLAPFNTTLHLIYAVCGIFIWSAYVVLDVHLTSQRLSPDEYVMGAVLVYVDFLNVARYIFRSLKSDLKDKKKNGYSETIDLELVRVSHRGDYDEKAC